MVGILITYSKLFTYNNHVRLGRSVLSSYDVGLGDAKIQGNSVVGNQGRAGIGDRRDEAIEVGAGGDGDVDRVGSGDPNRHLARVQWRPIWECKGNGGDLLGVGLVLQDFEAGG